MSTIYERIGGSYGQTRQPDPRIAALVRAALGDAQSVVNVGAGTGAYEPTDCDVLAIEPSATMIAQRPALAPKVIQAAAEALPLPDRSFDAALCVNTLHHWTDLRAGLCELRRVARKRVVIFLRDARAGTPFWLTQDYLPSLDPAARLAAVVDCVVAEFPTLKLVPVRLPHDCVDGLFTAYWGRPERYLDAAVRQNISNFSLASQAALSEGLASLRSDLESGVWDRKYRQLRTLPELDLGHRLMVAEVA